LIVLPALQAQPDKIINGAGEKKQWEQPGRAPSVKGVAPKNQHGVLIALGREQVAAQAERQKAE
jgi:hypothetical protein